MRAYKQIPTGVAELSRQVAWAYNANSLVLCSAGLRALLETISDERSIAAGSKIEKGFNSELAMLRPYVGNAIVDSLRNFDELGNYAVHEASSPEPSDVEKALLVVEEVIEIVYDLGPRVSDLHGRVRPNRTRPPTKIP